MSESGLTGEIVFRVVKAHGVSVDALPNGTVLFAKTGFDPLPIVFVSTAVISKAIVQRLARGFAVPIGHFYNSDQCSEACRFGGDVSNS